MKVVVTCGHPQSDYQTIHQMMVKSGLVDAGENSEESLSPQELQAKICNTYKLDAQYQAPVNQLVPGQFWSNAATDVFMTNLDNEYWGWADSNSVHLLEHWRDYEDNVRFVLVYNSPNRALAKALPFMPVNPETADQLTDSWLNYNDALLRFYYRNKERCVLINSDSAALKEGALPDLAEHQLSVDLQPSDTTELEVFKEHDRYTDIASLISTSLRAEFDDAESLYQELEAVADLPSQQPLDKEQLKISAWKQYSTILAEIENYKAISECAVSEREVAIENIQSLETVNQEMCSDRERLISELEHKKNEIQILKNEQSPLALDTKQIAELEHENHLLVLQLEQVQEELEDAYRRYLDLTDQTTARKEEKPAPKPVAKTEFVADLRTQTAPGENWHDNERDGRWMGPETTSSIDLPSLEAGTYQLKIVVVDAMTPQILTSLSGTVNGQTIDLTIPESRKGVFRKRPRYPVVVSGTVHLGDGLRTPSKLLLNIAATVAPASRGENDLRLLGIRIQELTLTRTGHKNNTAGQTKDVIASNGSTPKPFAPITIDFRKGVDGHNWHEAEHDGRWAGPEKRSTLKLPFLPKGRYRIGIKVVDSITPDVLKFTRASLDGKPHTISVIPQAPLAKRIKSRLAGTVSFPVMLTTNLNVSSDEGDSPTSLELNFPSCVRPTALGKPDDRELALRIQHVIIEALP